MELVRSGPQTKWSTTDVASVFGMNEVSKQPGIYNELLEEKIRVSRGQCHIMRQDD